MQNFEERLERLETLSQKIRKPEIPLDDALRAFEEGVRLARSLEKDLEKIENRVELLMNPPDAKTDQAPAFSLFDGILS